MRLSKIFESGLGLLSILALIALVLVVVAAGVGLLNFYSIADYPGSSVDADNSLVRGFPNPYFRRDTSYRTSDAFNKVFNHYSSGFDMGAEAEGQSSCSHLRKASETVGFRSSMAVTICDSTNGRLIFVQREVSLRFR
jgi:hypothetical protein